MTFKAVAVLNGKIKGTIHFTQEDIGKPTKVKACFVDLPAGKHGFHIHQYGDSTNGCTSAGSHFNPHGKNHGGPGMEERHVGDMGNVVSTGEHETWVDIIDDSMSLVGEHSVVGRSIVIHENEDDLGLGGHDDSLTTGHSGPRLACGVIGWSQ